MFKRFNFSQNLSLLPIAHSDTKRAIEMSALPYYIIRDALLSDCRIKCILEMKIIN